MASAAPPRAILFDIDDTLVDTKGAFRHALATVAAGYLADSVDADVLTTTWRTDAAPHLHRPNRTPGNLCAAKRGWARWS